MARKHADIATDLNTCLEWIQSGRETLESALAQFPEEADELRPMLETALWMQSQHSIFNPDEQRQRILKRRLISRIQQEQAAQQNRDLQAWFGSLFRYKAFALQAAISLVLVLALTFGSIGVAQASQGTIPGDALYGVKLTLEDAELAFSLSPLQDARLHIKFIGRRVIEIQSLVMENRLVFLNQAISRYQNQVDQALRSLKVAAERLPAQSAQLASQLQETLASQSPLFSILAETTPSDFRAAFTRLQVVTNDAISATNEVITTTENSSKATATLPPSQTPSSHPSMTTTANFTPTAIATAVPFLLPTENVSIAPSSTPTPTRTILTGDQDDDEVEVKPTKKPTKTPKPPKPTKTPKIKVKD